MTIYLIEKAWTDSFENESSRALGYELHSYVTSLDEAKKICDNGGFLTRKNCWVIGEDGKLPIFQYKELNEWKP